MSENKEINCRVEAAVPKKKKKKKVKIQFLNKMLHDALYLTIMTNFEILPSYF
jgi:hypothetical protein